MAKQTILLGTGANSGTGDPIRTAFTKVNSNFTELYNVFASIPAAQVSSDWNATSGITRILNKPTIPSEYSLPTASTSVLGGVKVDGTTVIISGSGVISAGAASATLSGTTLAPNVTLSSLTAVGVLTNLTVTNTITGSVTGNSGTVTNGVYTSGSYSNPSWLTSLAWSKLVGTPSFATVATTGAYADVTGKPTTFAPPIATTAAIGGVRVDGTTITVDGTGLIVVPASGHNHSATTLTGNTLASNIVTSSITSVGVITSGTWSGSFGAVSGATLTTLNASNLSSGTVAIARLPVATNSALGVVQVDGTTITISGGVISTATPSNAASNLTGTTLPSNIVNSSLTSLGTLTGLTISGSINSTATGTPTLTSSTNINLAAANAVVVTASPFRLASYTTTARNSIAASNGDMIYNTTLNKFQGYQNGTWVNLDGTAV
jgi:hypothetical protein